MALRRGEPVAVPLVCLCSAPLPWPQVVMKVVQLLPDGHRVKKEVDAALDTVSETMTPMHYHLREIIICTYRQVSPTAPGAQPGAGGCGREAARGPASPPGLSVTAPSGGGRSLMWKHAQPHLPPA